MWVQLLGICSHSSNSAVAKENGVKISAHTEAALRVLVQWTMSNEGLQF